ncbi:MULTISPECIES: hydantoinase B/oxoprolinase family protein [Rhodococcus]|uniref:hydantoinase B/oxoprolinase family protein n=1 Tax=Rhodococcus TaxID=1827 RepID=UPI001F2B6696|nr:hydantoinase B/oxoprolinase family protein [Rhodococcus opacus]
MRAGEGIGGFEPGCGFTEPCDDVGSGGGHRTLRIFEGRLAAGDAVLVNDPYSGAQHTPDILLFSPVVVDDDVVGYVGSVAHHIDVGGRVAGSVAGDNRNIFQEGLRIPPIIAYRNGVIDETFASILAANVRLPEVTFGDLQAQLSANMLGVSRVHGIAQEHGTRNVLTAMDRSIEATETEFRKRMADLPDACGTGEDFVEDDGLGNGPLTVKVSVEITGDGLVVDFTGSSPQTDGPINSVLSATTASVLYVIRSVFGPDLPANDGLNSAVRIVAPSGTIVNPTSPTACGGRMQTCYRVVDALLRACATFTPDRYTAGSCGNMTMSLQFDRRAGHAPIFFEVMPGALGARPEDDGIDGTDVHISHCMNAPIEALEAEFPIEFTCFEFRPDSCGAGRFQGGLGLRRGFRLRELGGELMIRGDQVTSGPGGVAGGADGQPCRFVLNPGTEHERVLPSKTLVALAVGDEFLRETAGGGGIGTGCDRDPALVTRDLADERISKKYIHTHYSQLI